MKTTGKNKRVTGRGKSNKEKEGRKEFMKKVRTGHRSNERLRSDIKKKLERILTPRSAATVTEVAEDIMKGVRRDRRAEKKNRAAASPDDKPKFLEALTAEKPWSPSDWAEIDIMKAIKDQRGSKKFNFTPGSKDRILINAIAKAIHPGRNEEWTAEQIETLIIKLTSTATMPSRLGFIDWTPGSFHRSLVNAIAEVLYEVTKEEKI